MRGLQSSAFAALALIFPSAILALPGVAVEPLPADCSSYPLYNASSNTAGPWSVVADSTGQTSIDGLKVSIETFTNNGRDRYGFITLPKQSPFGGNFPNTTLRCNASTIQAQFRSSWVDVSIASNENWQGSFSFGLAEPGIPIQPYAHVVNGSRVGGVFLGTKNSTTWNYKYNWGGNAGEYYILRWREEGALGKILRRALGKRQGQFPPDDRDWVGYLRVV